MESSLKPDPHRFKGLRCPSCGYDLTGLTKTRCPECGGDFDPDELEPGERYAPKYTGPTSIATITIVFLAYASVTPVSGPEIYAPWPLLVFIPSFMLSQISPDIICVAPLAILFLFWNLQLFRGESRIPFRTIVALPPLIALDGLYITYSWDYSIEYQGSDYTLFVTFTNAAALLIISGLFLAARRFPSFSMSLLFHLSIWWWLSWCAFPYMGEVAF